MNIKEFMSTDIIYANLRDGLHQTYMRMRERGFRHMPVLDDEEKLVGIISDRDLRRPDWLDANPNYAETFRLDNEMKVSAAMSPSPTSLRADDAIRKAVDLFIERRYGAIPIVDENDRVIGMLSTIDALRAFRQSLTD